MTYTIYLKERLSILDYQHIECAFTGEFDPSCDPVQAQNSAEDIIDKLLVSRLKDHKSLNKGDERKQMYYDALVEFYSTPREERRK